MAQNDSKPITVKLTSAKSALSEINNAIKKALLTEDSNLNKQFQDELKLQAQLSNLEDTLNLKGMALNGPIIGLTIPTLSQLYAPLRKILQSTYYPSDANPFLGDVAPSMVDNPAVKISTFTAASGDEDTELLVMSASNTDVVINQQIFGPGIPPGTSIVSISDKTLQLSNKLISDALTATNAYSVATAGDLTIQAKGGGSNNKVAVVNSAGPLTPGLGVSGDGIAAGTTISAAPDSSGVLTLSTGITGPLTGDQNAYTATLTIPFSALKPDNATDPGSKGQSTIKYTDAQVGGAKVSTLLAAGQSISGLGIPAGTKIKSHDDKNFVITLTANLTANVSTSANAYKATSDSSFTVQATQGSILELTGSTQNLAVGQWIVGPNIPQGTTIATVDPVKNTITLSTIMTGNATDQGTYTIVPVPVVNFWIQFLIYKALDSDFRGLLANYKDTNDASLEEEMVYYIQKQISGIVERDLTPDRIYNLASTALPGIPDITDDQSSIVALEVDNSKNTGFNVKIDEIESSYYDSLNGFESGVFPPPGGRDFLTNLENQIMLSIKQNVSNALKAKGKSAPTKAQTAALGAVTNEINVVRAGVHDALFNQIAEMGIQGTLIADTYDNEISKGVKQNVTSLLNGTNQFKTSLSDINATARVEANSILNVRDDVETFRENFAKALESLQANANSFSSGNVSYNSLYSTLNGKGAGNLAYLNTLIGGTGSSMPVLDDVESRSVQVSAEVAGLLYLANSILVPQTPLNQATTLDNSISAQVSDDVTSLAKAMTDYATALANYLASYQSYKAAEQSVEAGSTVEDTVTGMLTSSPSTSPNFN